MNICLNLHMLRPLIKARFGTAGRCAKAIGVHRNSISGYLAGKSLLPESVERLLQALGVSTLDSFLPVVNRDQVEIQKLLAEVVAGLVKKSPESSVVLFGSRARGGGRKYSDIDLGIIKGTVLSLKEWSDLRTVVDEQTEDLPFQVDLVDLGRGDRDFLEAVAVDAKFLGGSPKPYLDLVGKLPR